MPVFGYHNCRGMGHPVRLLLQYVGEDYEEKTYIFGVSDGNREDWLKEKYSLGLTFPNLPYFIDGDFKMVQSMAIMRYIGEKYDMIGRNRRQRAKVEMCLNEAFDQRLRFFLTCASSSYEEAKKNAAETQRQRMKDLEQFLEEKEFLMGEITIADFYMYENLHCWRTMIPALISDHPNVEQYMKRFEALPKVAAFLSSKIGQLPIHPPNFRFGGLLEE